MRNLVVHFLVLALVFGFPGALTAGDYKWIGQDVEKKWQSHAEFTGRGATNSLYGVEVSPFIPIAQNDNSIWFLNLRNNMFWKHGDFGHEFNIGGGYRRLMGDDGNWILGAYGFFDRLNSHHENHFNQGTLGVEAMWADWDARINGYLASDDEKFSDGEKAKASFEGGRVVVKSGIEQALSGFDAELGWRLPFDRDSVLGDTRIYAGGYFFDADLVNSLAGPKTRLEMRIHDVPGLWEGSRFTVSGAYRWDNERGSDVTGLIGLRIPIGAPNRSAPLTYVERRMTDSVVRDVFVVTRTALGKSEDAITGTGARITDTAFFDSDGDGSISDIDDPGSVGDAALCGAGCLLVGLDLSGDVDVDNVFLDHGQTVAGGGTHLVVSGADSGQKAVFTVPGEHPATITNDDTTAFILAENNTVAGLIFDFGVDRALELELGAGGLVAGVSTAADIYSNTFIGMRQAIEVDVQDGSTLELRLADNLFAGVGTGLDLFADDSFNVTVDVFANEFLGGGGVGLDFQLQPDGASSDPSVFELNVALNKFADLDIAIDTHAVLSEDEDYTHTTSIVANLFDDNDTDYHLSINGYSPAAEIVVDVELAKNHTDNSENFAHIEINPYYGTETLMGSVDIAVTGNDIQDIDDDAIEINVYDAPDVNIAGSCSSAMTFVAVTSTMATGTIAVSLNLIGESPV